MDVTKTFNYRKPFHNHYAYCGAVDDHNNKHHDGGQGISLEEAWITTQWENCVFAFILAIVEVNMYLACRYFYGHKDTFLGFRKKLVFALLQKDETTTVNSIVTFQKAQQSLHKLISALNYCAWCKG